MISGSILLKLLSKNLLNYDLGRKETDTFPGN